jgi:hypothetical protein
VGVNRHYGVVGHDHVEVADVCVQGAVEDALLGDLAGWDDALDVVAAEQVAERGLVEGRVARLPDKRVLGLRLDCFHQLGVFAMQGTPNQVVA